ncbi:TPA: hypothetical protein N0F65_000161 [Lagenidium giganteum]|uniref:Histone-lysine N-methyltransferase, H3 lysine-79 specific n=1 Tax=Lagenidium giganteum TaxID=4803 RepID=A0AAV2YRG4_9STRA|nr:TPA: hypothetical protein N0F65_000161 [Lagenidium giganteum]
MMAKADIAAAQQGADALLPVTVVENALELHRDLFKDHPEVAVKKVSRLEREAKELPNRSLVYGEIPFESVAEIFTLMRTNFGALLERGGNFYDIGSGCGKVTIAAALLHDFSKCCGIEVIPDRTSIALQILDVWRYQSIDKLPSQKADIDIGFVKGDASKMDMWKDATLVFCNSTCFSDSLLQAISNAADSLREGCYFVTVTKPLVSTRWKTVLEQKFQMSWGKATVIIQKKVL